MENNAQKSIIEMARGAFIERINYEMPKIIDNIFDANTKATAKRKLTITMEFTPDDSRQNIPVSFSVKTSLAPTNPVTTTLYAVNEDNVVEMVPQIPGQLGLDTPEQEAPASLKIIKFA